jgi:hypothetical protein
MCVSVPLSGGQPQPVVGEFRMVPLATSERSAAPSNPKVGRSVAEWGTESVCKPGGVMEADRGGAYAGTQCVQADGGDRPLEGDDGAVGVGQAQGHRAARQRGRGRWGWGGDASVHRVERHAVQALPAAQDGAKESSREVSASSATSLLTSVVFWKCGPSPRLQRVVHGSGGLR